jgi:hypothetical protein
MNKPNNPSRSQTRDKWRVDERLSTLRSTGTGETK